MFTLNLLNESETLKSKQYLSSLYKIIFFCLITALSSQFKIYLPFTPVPITGQTFAVLLSAFFLTPFSAMLSLSLYFVLGVFGLPFFSHTFTSWGPSSGYLVGMIISAGLGSVIFRSFPSKNIFSLFFTSSIIHLIIYIFGCITLQIFIKDKNIFVIGVLPFLIGDIIKTLFFSISIKTYQLLK